MNPDIQAIIEELQRQGKLAFNLTPDQIAAISRSLERYSEYISQDSIQQITDAIAEGLRGMLNPQSVDGKTIGVSQPKLEEQLQEMITRLSSEDISNEINLDFIIGTARDVARGAGNYAANQNPTILNAFPADELFRIAPRMVPRGFLRKGRTIIPVPMEDWPHRFVAAARASGDSAALAAFEKTGRMIALKNSPLWQALGDGAGGYDDTLGNPYAPFAFNSGFWTRDVNRATAQQLGLILPGQKIQPVSLANLFSIAA